MRDTGRQVVELPQNAEGNRSILGKAPYLPLLGRKHPQLFGHVWILPHLGFIVDHRVAKQNDVSHASSALPRVTLPCVRTRREYASSLISMKPACSAQVRHASI